MSKKNEIAVSSIAAFDSEGKLLFGLRADSSKWTLPGGHADEGESPEKCAVRELLEETGLKPTELENVGNGRVPRADGDIRVTAFKAKVEGEPTADNDPDSEITEFRWVDVSDGLPDEIAHNLFAPMNVVLRIFGLQGGKLLKVEGDADRYSVADIVGNYNGSNPAWVEVALNLIHTLGARSAIRQYHLTTEGQNHNERAHSILLNQYPQLVADLAPRELQNKISHLFNAINEIESDAPKAFKEALQHAPPKMYSRDASSQTTGDLKDHPEIKQAWANYGLFEPPDGTKSTRFKEATQKYMDLVEGPAPMETINDTIRNFLTEYSDLNSAMPHFLEGVVRLTNHILTVKHMIINTQNADKYLLDTENYVQDAPDAPSRSPRSLDAERKRYNILHGSGFTHLSDAAIATVVKLDGDSDNVKAALEHPDAGNETYRAVFTRQDWTYNGSHPQPEIKPPAGIVRILLHKRLSPRPGSVPPSDEFVNQLYDATRASPASADVFASYCSVLPENLTVQLAGNPKTYDSGNSRALLVDKTKETIDKIIPIQMELLGKLREGAVNTMTYGPQVEQVERANRLITSMHAYLSKPELCNAALARKCFDIWPNKMATVYASRPDTTSDDLYHVINNVGVGNEGTQLRAGQLGIVLAASPATGPEHIRHILNKLPPETIPDVLFSIVGDARRRGKEDRIDRLFPLDTLKQILAYGEGDKALGIQSKGFAGDRMRRIVAPHLPKDLLDNQIAKEPDSITLQELAINRNADANTVSAFLLRGLNPGQEGQSDPQDAVPFIHLLKNVIKRQPIPDSTWYAAAQHPSAPIREVVASNENAPDNVIKMLGLDPDSEVQGAVTANPKFQVSEELRRWYLTEAPESVVIDGIQNFQNYADSNPIVQMMGALATSRALVSPNIVGPLIEKWPRQTIGNRHFLDAMLDSDALTPNALYSMLTAGKFVDSGFLADSLDETHNNKMFEKILSPAMYSHRGGLMHAWVSKEQSRHMSIQPAQIQRIIDADAAAPQTDQDFDKFDTPNLASSIAQILGDKKLSNHVSESAIERLAQHPSEKVSKMARQKIGPINPDALHKERVGVKFDTGKLRAIRDLIMESGTDSMPANKLPPMEWDVPVRDEMGNVVKRKITKRSGKEMKEVEEVVKKPLPVRDAQGNISASMIQAYINALPAIEFNISHGKKGKAVYLDPNDDALPVDDEWTGGQRHNEEYSKVFQLNITNNHVNAMRAKGSWQTYRNQADAVHSGGHPVRPEKTTIGWLRYTGTPKDGLFIDEVQSDFGQSFVRQAVQQAKEKAEKEASEQGLRPKTQEYDKFVEDYVAKIRADATSKWPDEHNKNIAEVLFGGRHSNEIIHEAFHQYLRDNGHVGVKVAIHTPSSKAPLSGLQQDRDFPAHFKITYGDVPKKMGYKPSTYGTLLTQDNMDIKRIQPREPSGDEKWAPSKDTWETKVRKYESSGLDCFYVLAKEEDDLADMAQRNFEADDARKWEEYFTNPETPFQKVVNKLSGYNEGSEALKVTPALIQKIINARYSPTDSNEKRQEFARLGCAIMRHPETSTAIRESICDKVLPWISDDQDDDAYATPLGTLTTALARSGTPSVVRKLLDAFPEGTSLGDTLPHVVLESANTNLPVLKMLVDRKQMSAVYAAVVARKLRTLPSETETALDERNKLLDTLVRRYADQPLPTDYGTRDAVHNILNIAVGSGTDKMARYIASTPHIEHVLETLLLRSDLNEQDIQNVLESKYINFKSFSHAIHLNQLFTNPALNKRHIDYIFDNNSLTDGPGHDMRLGAFRHANPALIDARHINNILLLDQHTAGRDEWVEAAMNHILTRDMLTPEQIETVLTSSPRAAAHTGALLNSKSLNSHLIHKMIEIAPNTGALDSISDHPEFGTPHIDSLKRRWDQDGGRDSGGTEIPRIIGASPHTTDEQLLEWTRHPDENVRTAVWMGAAAENRPLVFEHPEFLDRILQSSDKGDKERWAYALRRYRTAKNRMTTAPGAPWSEEMTKRLLLDPHHIGKAVLATHKFDDDMMRFIANNAPFRNIHEALSDNVQPNHSFPMDARHALFARVQEPISELTNAATEMYNERLSRSEFNQLPGHPASALMRRMLNPGPDDSQALSIPDLTSEQLAKLVDKYKEHERSSFLTDAIKHKNFPTDKLREIAKWPELPMETEAYNRTGIDHPRATLRAAAREIIGVEDPDALHNENVHLRFDLGKARKIRDDILATGQEELRPKEIPNLPNNWKIGRNPKNGNINAKMIQEAIDKTPAEMYNISHSTYGDNLDFQGSGREECENCGGRGEVDYEHEDECPTCEGKGVSPEEPCFKCEGEGEIADPDVEGGKTQCDYCDGAGSAPPPCNRCEGTGRFENRICRRCDGNRFERCGDCNGNGSIKDSGTETCEDCGGDGSIEHEPDRENDSVWKDALNQQQHNRKQSQVLQVNFATRHVDEMKKRGVWNTFRNMYEAYTNTNHPVTPSTIGWIRYTYGGEHGGAPRYFVDEFQSDFGQSFVRQAVNEGIQEGKNRAKREGIPFNTPEWAEYVRGWAQKAKVMAEQKWPEAHHKHISEVLFGKRHSNEILFESFFQHLRDKGHSHAIVTMPHLMLKAKISLHNKIGEVCKGCGQSSTSHKEHPDFDEQRFNLLNPSKACNEFVPTGKPARTDAPGHFNVTYIDLPVSNGMQDATYGHSGNPDEDNPRIQGEPTFKGPVRKYEDEFWGIPSRNLLHKTDPFDSADWTNGDGEIVYSVQDD